MVNKMFRLEATHTTLVQLNHKCDCIHRPNVSKLLSHLFSRRVVPGDLCDGAMIGRPTAEDPRVCIHLRKSLQDYSCTGVLRCPYPTNVSSTVGSRRGHGHEGQNISLITVKVVRETRTNLQQNWAIVNPKRIRPCCV
jgi:hypothetical protein